MLDCGWADCSERRSARLVIWRKTEEKLISRFSFLAFIKIGNDIRFDGDEMIGVADGEFLALQQAAAEKWFF